ncbi:hypothetical protein Baya_14537 [Bagarius yarrelli]|uniref:Secreted protein n=1 Tax=Bagarius yarrelli TaxID=175774 RepID=A0A556V992_BAGYA|nr:hypothetical protein Baya_14537 [Bagarius yarrelli]
MQRIQGHGFLLVFAQCHFMLIESAGATQNALFSSFNEDILSPCGIYQTARVKVMSARSRKRKATCLRSATRRPGVSPRPVVLPRVEPATYTQHTNMSATQSERGGGGGRGGLRKGERKECAEEEEEENFSIKVSAFSVSVSRIPASSILRFSDY